MDARSAQVHNLTVAGLHTYHVETGDLDLLNHNCEVSLYRSPGTGNRASEQYGFNANNHAGSHPTVYLANKPEGAAQYAGKGHDYGFHRFTMKLGFQEAFGKLEFPLPNKTGMSGLAEWRIPENRFKEFNSYIDHSKTQWWYADLGSFYPP